MDGLLGGDRMSHVLITSSSDTPTVELIKKNMAALAKIKSMEIKEVNAGRVTKTDIQWADTVIIIRPFDICCTDIALSLIHI